MADVLHKFHIADLIIFVITILISISIGIYYAFSGDRQRTTSEYLVGGRKMNFLPVAISLLVSFESSIMMLGVPAEVYVYGIQWWIFNFGLLTANLISICLVVPLFHPLKLTSVYEYLEMRFKSKAVRKLGSVLGILMTLWYMGVVLFGPGIALEAVTGFPKGASIALVAFAAAIYTSMGGLKAVIWTDVFQAIIMFSGCFAILIKGTIYSGGPTAVWEKAEAGKRLNFFVFIFATFLLFLENDSRTYVETSQRILFVTSPAHFIVLSLAAYEGIVAFAYYTTIRCDPLASGSINDPNQVIPYMVMDVFHSLPGMPGLFLASLFSASLSTLSTGLSSLSANFLEDVVKELPWYHGLSDLKNTIIAKASVLVSAVLAIGVAYMIAQVGGTMTQIASTLISAFSGPLTGIFLLGCLIPWSNTKGVMVGTLTSVVLCVWLGLGSSFSKSLRKEPWLPAAPIDHCPADNTTDIWTLASNVTDLWTTQTTYPSSISEDVTEPNEPQGLDKMYSLSYTWFGAIGVITNIVVGSIVSLLTENANTDIPGGFSQITPSVILVFQIPLGEISGESMWIRTRVRQTKAPIRQQCKSPVKTGVVAGLSGWLALLANGCQHTSSTPHDEIDTRYLLPYLQKVSRCLPEGIKHFLRLDLDFSKEKMEKPISYIRGHEITIPDDPEKPPKPEQRSLLYRDDERDEHQS